METIREDESYISNFKEFIQFPLEDQLDSKILNMFYNQNKQILSQNIKSICFIGATGSGKSSTANSLINQNLFNISDSVDSCTQETQGIFKQLKSNKNNSEYYFIIDTPGIGDSLNKDQDNVYNIVNRLKILGYVHSFVITVNSQELRFDKHLKDTLSLFKEIFGECFTRFSQSKLSKAKRSKGKEKNQDQYIQEFQNKFNEKFKYKLSENQFMFIDNQVMDPEDCEPQEIEEFQNSLQKIILFNDNAKQFFCKDIQEALQDNEKLLKLISTLNEKYNNQLQEKNDYIQQLEKQVQENKKKYESQLQKQKEKIKQLTNDLKIQREVSQRYERQIEEQKSNIEEIQRSIILQNQVDNPIFLYDREFYANQSDISLLHVSLSNDQIELNQSQQERIIPPGTDMRLKVNRLKYLPPKTKLNGTRDRRYK